MKFTRETLTRGTKLVKQVLTPLQTIATALARASLERDNLPTPYGVTRINFQIPAINADMWEAWTAQGTTAVTIPFVLPPPQEYFDVTGKLNADTPIPILDEISISWDSRAEGCAITDHFNAPGRTDWTALAADMDMTFRMYEKRTELFDASAPLTPEREVVSVTMPGIGQVSRLDRRNPFLVENINQNLHPYRTYLIALEAPKLFRPTDTDALVNLTISLKLRYPLVTRDLSADVQNAPTGNAKAGGTYTITMPATNALISETHIQGNVEVLDRALTNRLDGGYGQDSSVPQTEQVLHDSTYTIIAIPMHGNRGAGSLTSQATSLADVCTGVAPYTDIYCDRRIIPLRTPFVLHHAIACVNYTRPASTIATSNYLQGCHPSDIDLTNQVGLAVFSGIAGDTYTYQQVLDTSWNPPGGVNPIQVQRVDRVSLGVRQAMTRSSVFNSSSHNWDLLSLPLMRRGGQSGTGYLTQGKPFFMGRSHSGTSARTNVGTAGMGSVQPNTKGGETYLEARWSIQSPNGLSDSGAAPPGGAGVNYEVYVGQGGHWLLLYGKTSQTSGDDNSGLPV